MKTLINKTIILLMLIILCGCSHVNFIYAPDDNYNSYNEDYYIDYEEEIYDEPSYNEQYGFYSIYVNGTMNIRDTYSTQGSVVGRLAEGSRINAYEEVNNENLTWYRIGGNEWVANDGTWLSVTSEYTNNVQDIELYYGGFKLKIAGNISVFNSPNNDAYVIGSIGDTSVIYAYSQLDSNGYTWYEIGSNEWIRSIGSNITIVE